MHNVLEMIEVYDLPTNSLSAIQAYNERARAGKYDYGAVLRSLLGEEYQELENPDHARVQVGYVLQLAIEANIAGLGDRLDPAKLYTEATHKARKFAKELSWAFAKPEKEVKLDADGKPRPKKGSKGDRSYEVYCDIFSKVADTVSEPDAETRKEIIEAFQNEEIMGMKPHSKSGATTYYYNMKRKYEAA